MMTSCNYNKGSEWHKWDLHLHSCHTFLNGGGFPHDTHGNVIEDDFISNIKDSGISAVGLTNYFRFSESDFRVKKKLETLGVKTFLNLELRLNHLNHESQNFDYHIIFDDKLDDLIIQTFLSNMDADIGSTSKKLSQLTNSEIEHCAQVNFDKLIEKLDEESSGLKGRYLLGFLSRGHGNARARGRDETNYEKIARKSHFVIHSSDNPDNVTADRNYWLNISPYKRPLLQGSDAHNLESIGSKYSWIKADLTFDGLKQIIFEPEDRISLDIDNPDKKNDYQVIDKVIFIQNDDCNNPVEKIVSFNPNLNTVIGGRSNGKSTLTNSVAKALNNRNFLARDDKNGSGMFAFKDESNLRLFWKDGQINKGEEGKRDVEFLPQDYMIRIAENDELRNKLIEDTVKADKENYQKIIDYDKAVQSINNEVDDLIRNWSNLKNELSKLVPPEGDKQGIKAQIEKLNIQINEQQKKNNFSDEDSAEYEMKKNELAIAKNIKRLNETNSTELGKMKQKTIEIRADYLDISKELQQQLQEFILEQQIKLDAEWKQKLSEVHETVNSNLILQDTRINDIIDSEAYTKGQINIASNETLMNLSSQLRQESEKLDQLSEFEEDKDRLLSEIQEIEIEIISHYSDLKKLREALSENFSVKATSVEIELSFVPVNFESYIDYLHGRNSVNNTFIQDFDNDFDKKFETIFDDLELSYNKGRTQNDLIKDILSRQWFKRNYILKFEEDDFLHMSQGKKAFVILTLILEFSQDEKPVIIDQPEDSLDNRAIYNELTRYLKSKKKDRQIILVTHNPNIVVGADAENVIIANQLSDKSPNENGVQFDYINGSLENSKVIQTDQGFLNSKGIREHVVEILEGGDEAFKKREEKYNFVG